MTPYLFYFFAIISVLIALFVITAPKPTRALLSLIVSMFALAVIYLLLGAFFVAMAHIIVYAGAVLVLFLFVIMLQGTGARELPLGERFGKIHILMASIAAAAFLALLVSVVGKGVPAQSVGYVGTTEIFGSKLFQDYLLPFELTSLLLLVGVFAAVTLAKKDLE